MATAWDITADVREFSEAVTWFQKRTVLTAEDALKLNERARGAAFWVGGGLQLQQVQDVFQALDKSIAKGETFEEFRARLKVNLKPAHASIVFRNATQRAYNAGRYQQMTQPDVLKFRPFWMYDAVLDSRTTSLCASYNGTLLPAEDDWWATRIPPNHHGCRASIRSMRRSEAERRGVTTEPSAVLPAEGWAQHPLAPTEPPKGKDEKLVAELKRKTVRPISLVKSAVATELPLEHTVEHWITHYSNKGYSEAAQSLGWGRAMLERGLDTPAKEILQLWESAGLESHPVIAKRLKQPGTVREIFGELDTRVNTMAAVAAHRKAITPSSVTFDKSHLSKALQAQVTRAERVIASLVDARRVVPTYPLTIISEELAKRYQIDKEREFADLGGFFGAKAIYLANSTSFKTVFHEWGHTLESEVLGLLERSLDWLRIRRGSEPYRPFAHFDPNHPDKGLTFRDELDKIYIGKRYTYQFNRVFGANLIKAGDPFCTEAVSVGANAIVEGTTDLEHVLFVLGQYSGQ